MKNTSLSTVLLVVGMTIPSKTFTGTIPFELVGNLIVVKGSVDGQYGNFILDTGVPDLILNNRYFEGEPSDKVFQGINGQTEKVSISYSKIELGDNLWKGIYTEIIPMRQLEDSRSVPIHGLLGTRIFQDYILMIDFENLKIELFPLDKKGENADFLFLTPPTEVLAFQIKGGAPLITTQIGEQNLKMTIDTGAEINLIRDAWLEQLVKEEKDQDRQKVGGLGSGIKNARIIRLSNFRVGSLNCRPMRIGGVDLDAWNRVTYGPIADGILGYEFLTQFWVAINFKKREMYLWDGMEPLGPLLTSIRK